MKKKFLSYKSYSDATLKDMFNAEQLTASKTIEATFMETVYLENKGTGFVPHHLPLEAQYSPVYAIVATDIDGDGNKDILLTGNNTWTRVKFGRYAANHGIVLSGNGKGDFTYVPQYKSGLDIHGNIRSAALLSDDKILIGINDQKAVLLHLNKKLSKK